MITTTPEHLRIDQLEHWEKGTPEPNFGAWVDVPVTLHLRPSECDLLRRLVVRWSQILEPADSYSEQQLDATAQVLMQEVAADPLTARKLYQIVEHLQELLPSELGEYVHP